MKKSKLEEHREIYIDTLKTIRKSGMLKASCGITITSTLTDETINILQKPYILKKEITPQHIKQLFYAYLEKQDDLYKEVFLDIKNNNRINYIISNKKATNAGTMCDMSEYNEPGNAFITVNKQENPILELLTFIHELAHAVDREKDKQRLTEEEFNKVWFNFQVTENKTLSPNDQRPIQVFKHNPYVEVPAELAELEALYIWIDEKRIDSSLAKYLLRETSIYRIGEISFSLLTTAIVSSTLDHQETLCGIFDNNDIPDNMLRFYAHSLSLYFANIEDKERKKELLDIFHANKSNLEGKEMFEALEYDSNALKDTIKKHKIKRKSL